MSAISFYQLKGGKTYINIDIHGEFTSIYPGDKASAISDHLKTCLDD